MNQFILEMIWFLLLSSSSIIYAESGPFFKSSGLLRTIIVCDNEMLHARCSDGDDVIVFEAASYGRTSPDVCGRLPVSDCVDYSTLRVVNDKCFGENDCAFRVDQIALSGWQCPGIQKYLTAAYRCVQKNSIYNVCENRPISNLPAYIISPNYPDWYEVDSKCTLTLNDTLSGSSDTIFTVLDIDVYMHAAAGCLHSLVVEEADDPKDKFLYCGTLEENQKQLRNRMRNPKFVFETDDSFGGRGFLLALTKNETLKDRKPRKPIMIKEDFSVYKGPGPPEPPRPSLGTSYIVTAITLVDLFLLAILFLLGIVCGHSFLSVYRCFKKRILYSRRRGVVSLVHGRTRSY